MTKQCHTDKDCVYMFNIKQIPSCHELQDDSKICFCKHIGLVIQRVIFSFLHAVLQQDDTLVNFINNISEKNLLELYSSKKNNLAIHVGYPIAPV